LDTVKDMLSAISNRFRSKIVSSILLSFIAINWKVIFYVLFEPVGSEVKFAYFDANTSPKTLYWLPIILGLLIACITPWLTLLGQAISYHADKFRRKLVNNSHHDDLVDKLKYEGVRQELKSQRERSWIEEAKIDAEVKEIADPEVRLKLEQKLEEEREGDDDLIVNTGIATKVHPDDFVAVDDDLDEPPFTLDEFQKSIENYDKTISHHLSVRDQIGEEVSHLEKVMHSTRERFDQDIKSAAKNENDAINLRVQKVKLLKQMEIEIENKVNHYNSVVKSLDKLTQSRQEKLDKFEEYYE